MMSAPSALAFLASAIVAMSAIAMRPRVCTASTRVFTGTGLTRSVASKAMIAAPASDSASTSSIQGVIRTGVSGRSRFTRPMIGSEQAPATAATLATPSILRALAPALWAASAKRTTDAGSSNGPPGTGWHETTKPPFNLSVSAAVASCDVMTIPDLCGVVEWWVTSGWRRRPGPHTGRRWPGGPPRCRRRHGVHTLR